MARLSLCGKFIKFKQANDPGIALINLDKLKGTYWEHSVQGLLYVDDLTYKVGEVEYASIIEIVMGYDSEGTC